MAYAAPVNSPVKVYARKVITTYPTLTVEPQV